MNKESSQRTGRSKGIYYAFTIIELLVVIAIITLLAAILFPVFARAKVAAHKTADLAQIKQVGLGQTIYIEDYDSYYLSFPLAGYPNYVNGEKGQFWTDRQMPYVKSEAIYEAPTNKDLVYSVQGYFNAGRTAPNQPPKYRVTYALNPALSRAYRDPNLAGASNSTAIEDVAAIVLVGPSQYAWPFATCVEYPAGSGKTHYYWMFSDYGWGFELFGNKGAKGGFDGGVNFVYTDTHAKFQRAVDAGTHPGDEYPYKGRDLFRGYFNKAIIKENLRTDGTCPYNRGQEVY